MATDIKTNWMQDFNGNLFAPKTLVESIQNKDGKTLQELLDKGSGALTADKISYDDTFTQMDVNNVQSAIEYLVKNAIIYSIKTQLIPEECYKCENVSHCRGGMRCLSFLNNKNELSKDINCIN